MKTKASDRMANFQYAAPEYKYLDDVFNFFALKNWYMIGTLTKIFEGRKIAVSKNWYINWYINEMPKPASSVKSRFTRKER